MVKKYNEIEAKDNMKVDTDSNDDVAVSKERKEMQKIVTVEPKKVKRSLFGRLITGIVGPDGLPGIGAYVNDEIVKPAIKNIIVDAVTSGINMVMYGERNNNYNRGRQNHSGRREPYRPSVNYADNYKGSNRQPDERRVRPARYGVEDYIIDDRHDASHVLTSLVEQADRYDTCSIADYYELIGAESKFTDHSYGWTIDSITHATILPVRGGYIIKFPPVEVI
jgi:hypothetical protein